MAAPKSYLGKAMKLDNLARLIISRMAWRSLGRYETFNFNDLPQMDLNYGILPQISWDTYMRTSCKRKKTRTAVRALKCHFFGAEFRA